MTSTNPLSLLLDLFFPRFDSEYTNFSGYLTYKQISEQKPKIIYLQSQSLEKILACSLYQENISDLIKRAKINGEMAICDDFAKLILFAQKNQEFSLPQALCYVPSDTKRFAQRGYHLPEILAKKLGKNMNLPVLDILIKTKHTKSQTELDKKNRLTNLNEVFEIRNINFDLQTVCEIWLIDDVTTTHTTLLECSKVIKKNFPFLKISGVTLAG